MLKILKISLATIILFLSIITHYSFSETNLTSVIPEVPPILKKISFCESKNRQFDKNGDVLRGEINPKDVGYYQINEYYHLESSRSLGFDIYTLEGNTRYALYLYEHYGTDPWNWSKKCWFK